MYNKISFLLCICSSVVFFLFTGVYAQSLHSNKDIHNYNHELRISEQQVEKLKKQDILMQQKIKEIKQEIAKYLKDNQNKDTKINYLTAQLCKNQPNSSNCVQ